jgi:putative tricarboxylic transport membrane protein
MVRFPFLVVGVLTLVALGTFSIRNSIFDVGVAFFFGVVGLMMNLLGYSAPSAVLGLVLGRLLEVSFRRALILSGGDWMTFIERPISAVFIALSLIILAYPLIKRKKKPDSAGSNA